MRTSLNEIKQIEAHLTQQLDGPEETLFRAKLMLSDEMAVNVSSQAKTYMLIRDYGRKKFRQEVEAIHRELFTHVKHRSFRQKIMAFFS